MLALQRDARELEARRPALGSLEEEPVRRRVELDAEPRTQELRRLDLPERQMCSADLDQVTRCAQSAEREGYLRVQVTFEGSRQRMDAQ